VEEVVSCLALGFAGKSEKGKAGVAFGGWEGGRRRNGRARSDEMFVVIAQAEICHKNHQLSTMYVSIVAVP
jgi:hypothetical protein